MEVDQTGPKLKLNKSSNILLPRQKYVSQTAKQFFGLVFNKNTFSYITSFKQTRVTTSISSEAQRIQTSILIKDRENHVSP